MTDEQQLEKKLLENLHARADELRILLERINDHWGYEDGIYRFYHSSFKVYGLQGFTKQAVDLLTKLAPEGQSVSDSFQILTHAGTNRVFSYDVNNRWSEETSTIVTAFLHAKYFIEMAVKYGSLTEPPQPMPSGYAALLCLFNMR